MEQKLWKDSLLMRNIGLIALFIFSILSLILLLYSPESYSNSLFIRIFGFGILGLLAWVLYRNLRLRFNYITKEGIRVGNAYHKSDFILRQKPTFLIWNEIKEIKLINKVARTALGSGVLIGYLIIKTKDNKLYECRIYNKNSFIKALKKLDREYLLNEQK